MKVLLPLLLLLGVVSCQPKAEVHDEAWRKAQIDSIVGSRMEEINQRAMEDLDQRMSIVVKQKADSILAAREAAAPKPAAADSARTTPPMP